MRIRPRTRAARELGAEGIGLCRTEHMFMAEDRQPKMRAIIMADSEEARRVALAELLPLQQEDFEGLFEVMAGMPVTIRLLDPPLHEFLPSQTDLVARVEHARMEGSEELEPLERLLARVEEIFEENPMLGTRGCRLGILYPEIYEMQVHAILRAAKSAKEPPRPEIMIPLVDYEHEIELMRELVVGIGNQEGLRERTDYTVGTMIELPRACFVADRIARFADFFSFGTNDLTQTALGFSRDDAESKFVPVFHRPVLRGLRHRRSSGLLVHRAADHRLGAQRHAPAVHLPVRGGRQVQGRRPGSGVVRSALVFGVPSASLGTPRADGQASAMSAAVAA